MVRDESRKDFLGVGLRAQGVVVSAGCFKPVSLLAVCGVWSGSANYSGRIPANDYYCISTRYIHIYEV